MIYIRRAVGIFLASFLLLLQGGTAFAQTTGQSANGFRISPVRNELTVEKGQSQTVSVAVENPTGLPLKAKGIVNDFIPSDSEDGQPQLLLDGTFASSHSLKRLVQDIGAIDLAANERKDVKITVTVPTNAVAGGYYGAVRFLPADTKSTANVALTASVGSLFLVNVPGNIKQHLSLEQFSAGVNGKTKKIITGGQVSIITRLKNDGDTHEKPFGKIQVKDSHGKVVAEEEINNIEPQSNVLPSSIRKFETKLKNQKWFGRYTVTASYGYTPSDGELINAKTTFWYLPMWFIGIIGVAALVVLVVGYITFKRVHARIKKSRR